MDGAAYWCTSSTPFANPAVTAGRMSRETLAGIANLAGDQLVEAGPMPLGNDAEDDRHSNRKETAAKAARRALPPGAWACGSAERG